MTTNKDELLSHNYDGIQEYDNQLPRWWIWLFYLTIVYGIGYAVYLHLGPGLDQYEQLALDMKEHDALVQSVEAAQPKDAFGADALLALTQKEDVLAKGKELFIGKCMACHGMNGEGLVGPNLTDDYWLHGASIDAIQTVVTNGVTEKGMIAWKGTLSPEEIATVTAYVWSLHGSNPPNPKAPQGELAPRT